MPITICILCVKEFYENAICTIGCEDGTKRLEEICMMKWMVGDDYIINIINIIAQFTKNMEKFQQSSPFFLPSKLASVQIIKIRVVFTDRPKNS